MFYTVEEQNNFDEYDTFFVSFSSRFDPDRFSPEEIKKRPSLAYQPFGFAGKRKCPGCRMAMAEGLVFLSVLCRKFKFHLVVGQNVEPVSGLVTSPKKEIWITVKKRDCC